MSLCYFILIKFMAIYPPMIYDFQREDTSIYMSTLDLMTFWSLVLLLLQER